MEAAEPRSRRKRSAIRSSQDDSSSTTSKESISPRSKKTDEPVGVLDDKRLLFQEKVRLSNEACQEGDFKKAVQLYSEALILDPANHILFSNRSAANIKLKEYENALQDANKAKDLNPKWSKAYYRQGVALQCLGRHADALAAFASGLAQDPKSLQLQGGLIEATLKSPLKDTFEPIYNQLQSMKLDKSPFVIISVIGQELLAAGYHASSLVVLESALKIGTCSLKLRGSVFSALSSAHWGLGNTDQAIGFMQQDLAVAKSLGDQVGECRAHGNLGAAYFSKGSYKEALTHHRFQLVLAMKQKDRTVAASALSSLGHVYSAIGDYPNALASHKQCVLLAKQLSDKQFEAREIGNVGAVFLALGEASNALDCHKEHLEIAQELENKNEEARAYSNLGSAFHYKREFKQAIQYHSKVLNISKHLGDRAIEARACAGLGHAARCDGDLDQAKNFHEQQLNISLSMKDKGTEGRACSNLGIVYQQLGQYDTALKLHKAHLTIAMAQKDVAGQGRAYGNMGNAFTSLEQHDQAVKYHKQELVISREVNDRVAEASTHGNLAVAYQAMNMHDKAMEHYRGHLNISQELRDRSSQTRALINMGNYLSSRGEFAQALPHYDKYLNVCEAVKDKAGIGKAYHNLGYAHYSLGHYKDAVQFYEKDLLLASELKDKISMGRAYCNLGLAYRTLGNYKRSEQCQKCFLTIAHQVKNVPGKFRALGNLGDVYMAKRDTEGAVKYYEQQLQLAKQAENKSLEASAFGSLGAAHRKLKHYDKSLGFHTQELQLYQELNDMKGECKAHSHLGAVHSSLAKYLDAFKCYEEQLERSRELGDSVLQAQACGNLGISKMNMSLFEDALGFFEEQLSILEHCVGSTVTFDRGRAYGHLAECYESLGDYEDAVKNFEQYLSVAQKMTNVEEQNRAYQGLGNVQKVVGNLQQALFCFEKRLLLAHETENLSAKASAYGELGKIHSHMGNFEQSVSCLKHQLSLAKEMKDKSAQGDAACGLGEVNLLMEEFDRALEFHQMDLNIAEEMNDLSKQCRAFGNLGMVQESLGNFQKAIMYQEQHLSIAAELNDRAAKTLAYSSLGRVHHSLGNFSQSIAYLRQGLQIADQLGRDEDEAKIRYRLGLSLWSSGSDEEAQQQLYKAIDIFEKISHSTYPGSDHQMSMLDAQTASYQTLQRILVSAGRTDEALAVAERGKNKAFIDHMLVRQNPSADIEGESEGCSMVDVEQMVEVVKRQTATVLYFSIAGGHLHIWLLSPREGLVVFHDADLSELEKEPSDQTMRSNRSSHSTADLSLNFSASSYLDQHIMHARETLGVEAHRGFSTGSEIASETESEADDIFHQHLVSLSGTKLVDKEDHSVAGGNQRRNSSMRSLSSVHSLSGTLRSNGSVFAKPAGLDHKAWSGKPPLRALYDLLIAPVEDELRLTDPGDTGMEDLVLVLEGDLYMVPFVLLKGASTPPLHERFTIRTVPSIRALNTNLYWENRSLSSSGMTPAVVIGNPLLPKAVTKRWKWGDIPNSEREAREIAEMLGVQAMTGPDASKEAVLKTICQAECIHIAAAVSWKLSAVVLSPGEVHDEEEEKPVTSSIEVQGDVERLDLNDSEESDLEMTELPSLSQFLLTAADIAHLHLTAKLVVLSAYGSEGRGGRVTTDGVLGIARAFLAAGAQSVLIPMWPVSDLANATLMRCLYEGLLRGTKASGALTEGMRGVQEIRQFSHPSHWAGFTLIGCDVRLSNKSAMLGNALGDLLTTPTKCREALRVLLHLIEKSLQRINRGQANPMYTTQQSIVNKVGPVRGWQELLKSVGFRFEEEAGSSIPPSVFFPISDPGDQLLKASSSLQALLGLQSNTLSAICKMLPAPEAAQEVIAMLRNILKSVEALRKGATNHNPNKELPQPMLQHVVTHYSREGNNNIQVPVNVELWRSPGCHELLASLGFDLIDVGKEEVQLITSKTISRRTISYTVVALMSIFDPSETPKPLQLEQFSSMESLSSSHSGTSFSGMSLSAMSASSIISSHSLRGNVGASLENKISRSIVKSVKEGRKSFNRKANASTPKSTDKSQPHVTFQGDTGVSENLDFSPVTSSPGPVSRGSAQNRDLPQNLRNSPRLNASADETLMENTLTGIKSPTEERRRRLTFSWNGKSSPHGSQDSPIGSSRENLVVDRQGQYLGVTNPGFVEESDYSSYPSNISSASSLELTTNDLRNLVFRGRTGSNISSTSSEVFFPYSPGKRRTSPSLGHPLSRNSSGSQGSPLSRLSPSARLSPGARTSPVTRDGQVVRATYQGSKPNSRQSSLDGYTSGPRRLSQTTSESSGKESPHEAIAMKVLQDTMTHMNAVQKMQQKMAVKQSQSPAPDVVNDTRSSSSTTDRGGTEVVKTHPKTIMEETNKPIGHKVPPPIKAKPPRLAYFAGNSQKGSREDERLKVNLSPQDGVASLSVVKATPNTNGALNHQSMNHQRISSSESGTSLSSADLITQQTDSPSKKALPSYEQTMHGRKAVNGPIASDQTPLKATQTFKDFGRPQSAQSTNSSVYSSASSLVSVIHVPTTQAQRKDLQKQLPRPSWYSPTSSMESSGGEMPKMNGHISNHLPLNPAVRPNQQNGVRFQRNPSLSSTGSSTSTGDVPSHKGMVNGGYRGVRDGVYPPGNNQVPNKGDNRKKILGSKVYQKSEC